MLEILAILSPVFEVAMAHWMTEHREKIRRRDQLFQSLWVTRGDVGSFGRMSAEHVRALNMIEIEFSKSQIDKLQGEESASERVVAAWRTYYRALSNTPMAVEQNPSSKEATNWFAARTAS
jgi:hypothetical protein